MSNNKSNKKGKYKTKEANLAKLSLFLASKEPIKEQITNGIKSRL